MFQLLFDACVLNGNCSNARTPASASDPVSSAAHTSTNGIYTADQITRYRQCSTDYNSKFIPKWDGAPTNSSVFLGFAPKSGSDKMESFRSCWESINVK
mmetsp:Transcript_9901/g.21158  ORF Transcript_9901/g.21158 Transcript_9901/m.21158 type:complete len:99 (+) Transcript_9901:27-323(+)